MPWTWNPTTLRYHDVDTKRFLSRDQVLEWSQASIRASESVTATLAQYAANGTLSPSDWQMMMRDEIKLEHIRQYTLGIGGREQMTQSDWGKVGSQIKEQYGYLRGFADEVAAGNLTEAQIANRISMYVNSAREAYEVANQKAQIAAGMVEVLWVRNPALENCVGCQEFAEMGWQKIEDDPYGGAFPGSGDTPCLCILSPESLVLTARGWLPLLDVRVGDLVWTHAMRWKPVTGLVVKPSTPYHQAACLINPIGRKVWATTNHLWYTESGWHNITDIDSLMLSVYNLPMKEVCHGQDMSGMWQKYAQYKQARQVQILSVGMCLREQEGFSSTKMLLLCKPGKGNRTVAQSRIQKKDRDWNKACWETTAYPFRDSWTEHMAGEEGWSSLELVLGKRQEADYLSVPVGVDYETRPNTKGICTASHQWGCDRRPFREPEVDVSLGSLQTAWSDHDKEFKASHLAMSHLRERVQGISSLQKQRRIGRPKILFEGLLCPGTAVYDLQVADDHSFVIEGFFAHNTKCGCHEEYR